NEAYEEVMTAAVGGSARDVAMPFRPSYAGANVAVLSCRGGGGGQGQWITALASDGPTALVAYINIVQTGGTLEHDCEPWLGVRKTGRVCRAGSGAKIAGAPPSVAVAVSGRVFAVVPLDPDTHDEVIQAASDGRVEVFDLSGKPRETVRVAGTAKALALSSRV